MQVLARILWLHVLVTLISAANWFARKFGQVEWDQILYHLQRGSESLLAADTSLVRSGLDNILVSPPAYTALLLALAWWLVRWRRTRAQALRLQAAWRHPVGRCLALAATLAWLVTRTLDWMPSPVERRDWIAHLEAPAPAVTAPSLRRNLVMVYAESLETTYGPPAFQERLLAPLDLPGLRSVSFEEFRQFSGTGWTIAGIVSSQCGLPLKALGVVGENDLGELAAQFMPGARCLGDVLKAHGYRNVFLGGASARFAGKGEFLRAHGYEQVSGREEWLARNPRYPMNEWGLNDDDLMDQALDTLQALAAQDQPFNLTLLTVGMHMPKGFLAPRCPKTFGDFRDSVACTASLVSDFVWKAHARGLLEDTTVVIMGDHLSMRNEFTPRLEATGQRFIFNRIVNPATLLKNRALIDHFDMLPTVLTALGFELEGNGRFALGCSALGKVKCHTLAEDPQLNAKLRMHSQYYDALWRSSGTTPKAL